MDLFKGKSEDHGKMSTKGAAKHSADRKMRQIAKERPSGESARELKARDIAAWKQGRKDD